MPSTTLLNATGDVTLEWDSANAAEMELLCAKDRAVPAALDAWRNKVIELGGPVESIERIAERVLSYQTVKSQESRRPSYSACPPKRLIGFGNPMTGSEVNYPARKETPPRSVRVVAQCPIRGRKVSQTLE